MRTKEEVEELAEAFAIVAETADTKNMRSQANAALRTVLWVLEQGDRGTNSSFGQMIRRLRKMKERDSFPE